eukprot:8982004-Alexandrium_andersonii.AAC.1
MRPFHGGPPREDPAVGDSKMLGHTPPSQGHEPPKRQRASESASGEVLRAPSALQSALQTAIQQDPAQRAVDDEQAALAAEPPCTPSPSPTAAAVVEIVDDHSGGEATGNSESAAKECPSQESVRTQLYERHPSGEAGAVAPGT